MFRLGWVVVWVLPFLVVGTELKAWGQTKAYKTDQFLVVLSKSCFQDNTLKQEKEEIYFFRVTEAIFVGWFTLEYLIRFIVAPYKVSANCDKQLKIILFQVEFLFSFLNIIDLLGILPFFVSVILNLLSSQYSIKYIAKAAQIFRILRILRIFKLSRHITGLKTLGTTLRNSHR